MLNTKNKEYLDKLERVLVDSRKNVSHSMNIVSGGLTDRRRF